MLTLSAGFQKGRVCSRAQTGKPDITERRGGVGRSLRRPRSPARSPRSLCGKSPAPAAAGACLCSVRVDARGRGLEAPRRRRAGIAFAWERGASCRVHTPERKLRMKLLWQAKMVTRTLCLLPTLLWWGIFSRFLWAGLDSLGVNGTIRSRTLELRAFSLGFLRLPLCVSSPFKPYLFFSAVAFGVSGLMLLLSKEKLSGKRSVSLGEPRSASESQRLFKHKLQVWAGNQGSLHAADVLLFSALARFI